MTARAKSCCRAADLAVTFRALGGAPCILESFVHFSKEVSVVAARGVDGDFAPMTSARMCMRITFCHHDAPAHIRPETAARAVTSRARSPRPLDYVGVLAVEMFVVDTRGRCGKGLWSMRSPRASTIPAIGRSTARRPRNSSSICAPSPAGRSATRPAGRGVMRNLIGDDANGWRDCWGKRAPACISMARARSVRAARWAM